MSTEVYINAIRSSIKDTQVFLKRETNDIRINGYNPGILHAWEANHDIQFVTDAYACAMYIVSYISKGQRGMSDLLRKVAVIFVLRSELLETSLPSMSAQEAAYIALQLPMRRSSRAVLFINTSPEGDRPFILKDEEVIKPG